LLLGILFQTPGLSEELILGASKPTSSFRDTFIYEDIEHFLDAQSRVSKGNETKIYSEFYFGRATIGLKEFQEGFSLTEESLFKSIQDHPKFYASLSDLKERLVKREPEVIEAFQRLGAIYPKASIPQIYYLIGGLKGGGNGGEGNYVLVGADVFARKKETDMSEFDSGSRRLYHPASIASIVSHETAHILQESAQGREAYLSIYEENEGTLLAFAIREGSAEFVAKLISGNHINPEAEAYGNLHEAELWELFKQQANSSDLGDWFFYQPKQHPDWPKDLGYWMGYKISEAYYDNASDKSKAFEEIIAATDYREFLAKSRYAEKFQ
jgi:hypothetical protein